MTVSLLHKTIRVRTCVPAYLRTEKVRMLISGVTPKGSTMVCTCLFMWQLKDHHTTSKKRNVQANKVSYEIIKVLCDRIICAPIVPTTRAKHHVILEEPVICASDVSVFSDIDIPSWVNQFFSFAYDEKKNNLPYPYLGLSSEWPPLFKVMKIRKGIICWRPPFAVWLQLTATAQAVT